MKRGQILFWGKFYGISKVKDQLAEVINKTLQNLLMLTRSVNDINLVGLFFALFYITAMRMPQTLQNCSLQQDTIILICSHVLKHRSTCFNN